MKTFFTLIFAFVAIAAKAEPIAITRQQASDLYVALVALEGGLAPVNAIAAADDVNALRPIVTALDKGKLAAQRQLRAPGLTEEQAAAIIATIDEAAAFEVKVELTLLDLTPEEIGAAKIAPRHLAVIRQHLRKQKTP